LPYTIASRGRPIGTTELDFFRLDGSTRSGWFLPNALGEKTMPIIALVLPAVCAYVNRDAKGEDGQGVVLPSFRQSSLFADIAEAFDRVAALDLTLHRPDGTLVLTEMIGIQDTEQLLALTNWSDVWGERDPSIENGDDDSDSNLESDIANDIELLMGDGWEPDDDGFDITCDGNWLPEREPNPEERYQVHILLSQENSIP